jgi:hypothetical protein
VVAGIAVVAATERRGTPGRRAAVAPRPAGLPLFPPTD